MHHTAGLWLPLCSTPLSLSHSSFHFLYFFLFFYFWKFSFYSLSFTCAARCLSSIFCSLRPTLTPPLSLCLYHSFTSFNSKELNEDIHSVFLSFPLSATLAQSLFKFFFISRSLFSCEKWEWNTTEFKWFQIKTSISHHIILANNMCCT